MEAALGVAEAVDGGDGDLADVEVEPHGAPLHAERDDVGGEVGDGGVGVPAPVVGQEHKPRHRAAVLDRPQQLILPVAERHVREDQPVLRAGDARLGVALSLVPVRVGQRRGQQHPEGRPVPVDGLVAAGLAGGADDVDAGRASLAPAGEVAAAQVGAAAEAHARPPGGEFALRHVQATLEHVEPAALQPHGGLLRLAPRLGLGLCELAQQRRDAFPRRLDLVLDVADPPFQALAPSVDGLVEVEADAVEHAAGDAEAEQRVALGVGDGDLAAVDLAERPVAQPGEHPALGAQHGVADGVDVAQDRAEGAVTREDHGRTGGETAPMRQAEKG